MIARQPARQYGWDVLGWAMLEFRRRCCYRKTLLGVVLGAFWQRKGRFVVWYGSARQRENKEIRQARKGAMRPPTMNTASRRFGGSR
jgi:hypothetical protein